MDLITSAPYISNHTLTQLKESSKDQSYNMDSDPKYNFVFKKKAELLVRLHRFSAQSHNVKPRSRT